MKEIKHMPKKTEMSSTLFFNERNGNSSQEALCDI